MKFLTNAISVVIAKRNAPIEMATNKTPIALTIAGADCSAGAGIQADLKTFLNHGIHGLSAISCVVAETPREVRQIEPTEISTLEAQLRILIEHYPICAAKTGLLPSVESVRTTAEILKEHQIPLVVDPVMIASTGSNLTDGETIHALTNDLLPVATLVTPNVPEAEALLDCTIQSKGELEAAARDIGQRYDISCLLKGGHLPGEGDRLDVLWHQEQAYHFQHPFIPTPAGMHGTGCTLSAAITACLAQGRDMREAVARAIDYLQQLMKSAHTWEHDNHRISCLGW